MAFDRIEFFRICMDIEKYLGYLRANELALEYYDTLNREPIPMAELYQEHFVSLRDWKTPCPDEKFSITAQFGPRVWVPFDATQSELDTIDEQVRTNLTTAYENGIGWADGMALDMNETCQQFSHPDTASMAKSVRDMMTNVVEELELGAKDAWTDIGKYVGMWRGEAATAFFNFHTNYNDALSLFAHMGVQLGAGFAGATAVIHGTQETAMKFVESVREALEGMLWLWTEVGLQQPPEPSLDIDVGKILKIADGVWSLLQLIPPVAAATKGVNTAVQGIKTVNSIVQAAGGGGEVDIHPEPYAFTDWTANGLYTKIFDVLYEEIYQKYVEAMDDLHVGGGPANPEDADAVPFSSKAVEQHMLELQGPRNEWELEPVSPGNLNGGDNKVPYGDL